jgi:uncharacterized protein YcbX
MTMQAGMQVGVRVGTVKALWRYPVKSMAEESLESVDVDWQGLAGDRRWAFVQPHKQSSNFPWLTIRELPTMNQYRPRVLDAGRPEASAVLVRTPQADELDVTDPALAAAMGDGVTLIKQNRGTFDWLPLTLLTSETISAVSALVGEPMDPLRFRPNVYVESTVGDDFPEDAWVGRTLRIGTMRMRGDERDGRCVMVNVDPQTSRSNPAVLRTIARERQNCLGLHGSTVTAGRVAVGDPVLLED